MDRRHFLKIVTGSTIGCSIPVWALAAIKKSQITAVPANYDDHVKDYLNKIKNFNERHQDDIVLSRYQFRLLESSLKRLKRIQRTVGYARFGLLNFDDAIRTARVYSRIGRFTKEELNFLEMIFYENGSLYGFYGQKPMKNLTDRIKRSKVVKIPRTGHYIYKGVPLEKYKHIINDVGRAAILTSGLRSVTKQFMLFLNKAYKNKGNLSLASRSLAPPGYSFHGVGDFDIGQIGFGVANFSNRFTKTRVYKRLTGLGYVNLRYKENNMLGVRFEPWHIKVKG